jgi:seryl-tRNA synthetase
MTTTAEREALRAWLVDHGWLRLTSVDGVVARTGPFVEVERALGALTARLGADQGATVLRFPPLFPRASYELTDYLASFPQLTGSVSSFDGDERAAAHLVELQLAGEPWAEELVPTDLMLVSAACHPAYQLYAGTTLDAPLRLDVEGWCFRREPSPDPARMQCFRMHEYVFIGDAEGALAHRDRWLDTAEETLVRLGLPAAREVANDPFFGRAGRMLAANQRTEELKFEVVVPLYGADAPGTAVASSNFHRDHFGHNFAIAQSDGSPAQSACVGFGTERIVVALASHLGPDPDAWPAEVRELLWP